MGEERWGDWNGSHEHASDDEEMSPQQRLRTRSFSDAEDLLNGVGYYESFTLPDNPTTAHHSNNGLHHRVRVTIRPGAQDDDDYYRPANQSNNCQSPPKYATRRRHYGYLRRPSLFKLCLALGFGSYLVLLIRSSYWLAKSSDNYEYRSSAEQAFEPMPQHDSMIGRMEVRRLSRLALDERGLERRERTRPIAGDNAALDLSWYSLDKARSASPPARRSPSSLAPATSNQLCGFHAQNASLANPENYPASAAVNSNARVLITGILNPIGFALALHLKEKCGVEVIAGIDSMYPNTVLNRLQLQDRIQLLTTTIPKLVKPIILPFVGLDPRQKKEDTHEQNARSTLRSTEFNIMSLKPTHIVHLASYAQEVYSNAMVDPMWKNSHSPYVSEDEDSDPHLYQLRSSMSEMEQILEGIASTKSIDGHPQFIYASAQTNSKQHPVHATTKLVDEIMADSYHAKYGIQSTALRLPFDVYGPWGQPGFPIHDMIEVMVRNWNSASEKVDFPGIKPDLDLIYVEDAVESIIGAMQIRSPEPMTMNVASDAEISSKALAEKFHAFMPSASVQSQKALDESLGLNLERRISDSDNLHVTFTSQTPLKQGILKTIAWHLDREAPFGSAVETGDSLLKRFGVDTCAPEDVTCHMGRSFLPCSSECSTKEQCIPSVLDEVRELVYNVTEGCNIMLYTQSLGYNVNEMPLHSEFMDDATVDDDETLICNYAFVPRDSDLVTMVTDKVPNEQLAKMGIMSHPSDKGGAMRERKLDGLNGRLLYRGWILIWVKDAMTSLSVTDKSLLKLSPGTFFHPDVGHALYVEENFAVSPSIDDVSFLVQQMKRNALPQRTAKGSKTVEDSDGGVKKEKVKYKLPAEPKRLAALLFTPLRVPNIDEPTVQKYRYGQKKLKLYDAIKFMRHEIGEKWGEKESAALRLQREFYERVPSIINRNGELRSGYEPWYRYSMRHWVRTRWVVHDLSLEDSRLLRCDWYQEHVQWGNDLDQLSFAHVMAKREVQRRIAHREPDDHVKTFIEEHPELKEVTDSYEWEALETEHNKLYREPLQWNPEIPAHIMLPEQPLEEDEDDERAPIYVRIMSERVMGAARKVWNHDKKKKKH